MDQSEDDSAKSVEKLSMEDVAKVAEKKLEILKAQYKDPAERVSDWNEMNVTPFYKAIDPRILVTHKIFE